MTKFDFSELMSERTFAFHEAKKAEIKRLYDLSDRWLARELVNLSRYILVTCSRNGKVVNDSTAHLLWQCVPEIAFRLGEETFVPGERSPEIRSLTGQELRESLSHAFYWGSIVHKLMDANPVRGFNVHDVLNNDVCNGNPVLFGLDRVASPNMSAPDKMAAEIFKISRRRGHEPDYRWRPEFNSTPEPKQDDELPSPFSI